LDASDAAGSEGRGVDYYIQIGTCLPVKGAGTVFDASTVNLNSCTNNQVQRSSSIWRPTFFSYEAFTSSAPHSFAKALHVSMRA